MSEIPQDHPNKRFDPGAIELPIEFYVAFGALTLGEVQLTQVESNPLDGSESAESA